jgi:hypothetical protein
LDVYVVSVRNNAHFSLCVVSRLQNILKAQGEEEHAAGVSLTHAALRHEGFGVSRCTSNEEGSMLAVNAPDEWEELGGTARN